jgi:hypothetical protein
MDTPLECAGALAHVLKMAGNHCFWVTGTRLLRLNLNLRLQVVYAVFSRPPGASEGGTLALDWPFLLIAIEQYGGSKSDKDDTRCGTPSRPRLMTAKQPGRMWLHNFFNWQILTVANLFILAITNTIDLPERVMSGRVRSRLGKVTVLFFLPWENVIVPMDIDNPWCKSTFHCIR